MPVAAHRNVRTLRRGRIGTAGVVLLLVGVIVILLRPDSGAAPLKTPTGAATSRPAATQPVVAATSETPPAVGTDPFAEAAAKLDTLLAEGKLAEAADAARALLARREIELGASHPTVADALLQLAEVQLRREQFAEAERSLLRALDLRSTQHGDEHASLVDVWLGLARSSQGREQVDDAREALLAALEVSLKSHGKDHATTNTVRLQLARVLMQMKQHSAAQKQLTAAGRWLERHGSTRERRDGYELIARFYAQTGDRAQEALWRGRLATLPKE